MLPLRCLRGASAVTLRALLANLGFGAAGAAAGAVYPLLVERVNGAPYVALPVLTFGLFGLAVAPIFLRPWLANQQEIVLRSYRHPTFLAGAFWAIWLGVLCNRAVERQFVESSTVVLPLQWVLAALLGASALLEVAGLHTLELGAEPVLRGPFARRFADRAPRVERDRLWSGSWVLWATRALDLDVQRTFAPPRTWVDYRRVAQEPTRDPLTRIDAQIAVRTVTAQSLAVACGLGALAWACLHGLSDAAVLLGVGVAPTFARPLAAGALARVAGREATAVRSARAHVWLAWGFVLMPFVAWLAGGLSPRRGAEELAHTFTVVALIGGPVVAALSIRELLGYGLARLDRGVLHLVGPLRVRAYHLSRALLRSLDRHTAELVVPKKDGYVGVSFHAAFGRLGALGEAMASAEAARRAAEPAAVPRPEPALEDPVGFLAEAERPRPRPREPSAAEKNASLRRRGSRTAPPA